MRPLLVGEQLPSGASLETHSPLYPHPPACSGGRLRETSGLLPRDYLIGFDRVNLLPYPGLWVREKARWHALNLLRGGLMRDRLTILLGARVRAAFDGLLWRPVDAPEWFELRELNYLRGLGEYAGVDVVAVPHPSGRSRVWHDPETRERACALLRGAAGVD